MNRLPLTYQLLWDEIKKYKKMRIHVTLILIGFIELMPGCITRKAADSVVALRLKAGNEAIEQKFGLSYMKIHTSGQDPVVCGKGSHPREHETYSFFANEGYPNFNFRFLKIEKTDENTGQYQIIFLLEKVYLGEQGKQAGPFLLAGTFHSSQLQIKSNVAFQLNSVKLTDTVDGNCKAWISGKIVVSEKAVDADYEWFPKVRGEPKLFQQYLQDYFKECTHVVVPES